MTDKHETMPASLVIGEMQIKDRRRYHGTATKWAKKEHSCWPKHLPKHSLPGGSEQVGEKVKNFLYLVHLGWGK